MKKFLFIRIPVFIMGLLFMGFGISLIIRANLGTSPISSIAYVLSKTFPFSIGVFTFLLALLFLILQIILLNRKFPKKQYLQVVISVIFGFSVDLGMSLFSFVQTDAYVWKLAILFVGCLVLSMGIYLQLIANVLMNPGEGLVKTISDIMDKPFGTIKIYFDLALVLLAGAFSLCVFHSVVGIGVGTLISALLVGTMTKGIAHAVSRIRYQAS